MLTQQTIDKLHALGGIGFRLDCSESIVVQRDLLRLAVGWSARGKFADDPDNPGESLPVLAGNAELRITRPGAGVANG